MSLDQEPALYEARAAVWYAHPSGVTTFSQCSCPDCAKGERGGRLCPDHAEARIAVIIGPEPASQYASAIRRLRLLERQQTEIIRNTP